MTNQCNLIINELLCFVQCKTLVSNEVSLLQICESHFTVKEIDDARDILVQAALLRNTRKGEGKNKRNLQDIINVIKEAGAAQKQLPTFVAKNLDRLPPVTFDHVDVTTLLKDILRLKQDVHKIQVAEYTKSSEIENIQEQLRDLQSANKANKSTLAQRSAIPKNHKTKNITGKHTDILSGEVGVNPRTDGQRTSAVTAESGALERQAAPRAPRRQTFAAAAATAPTQVAPTRDTNKQARATSSPIKGSDNNNDIYNFDNNTINNFDDTIIDNSFTTVVNKKAKYRSLRRGLNNNNKIGKAKITSDKIKIVPRLSYIYISRFHTDTSERDIEEFVKESVNTTVKVEKLTPFRKTDFSSFKLTIDQAQETQFLNEEFWPTGVVYRRYKNKRMSQPRLGFKSANTTARPLAV